MNSIFTWENIDGPSGVLNNVIISTHPKSGMQNKEIKNKNLGGKMFF